MLSVHAKSQVTVSIVAKLPVQRYGLGALLNRDMELVPGQMVSAIDRITVGPGPRPHIILYYVDERAPESTELIAELIHQGMDIIVLVSRASSVHAPGLIQLGVQGVVGCGIDRRELASAIRHVASGRRYIAPVIASDLLLNPHQPATDELTSREQQVLARVAAGDTDREIAITLQIA
ncbi:MAG: hypothetical protein ACRCYQ_15760, partial [Nocardioides sp.]